MHLILSPYSKPLRTSTPALPKRNPKNYPYWPTLCKLLKNAGHYLMQVGASGEEPLIDADETHFDLHPARLRVLLSGADTFIAVDNFFPHFAHHYGHRGIVLFGPSNPAIYGYKDNINLYADDKNFRKDQFGLWESCPYNEHAFLSATSVMVYIDKMKPLPAQKQPDGYKYIG